MRSIAFLIALTAATGAVAAAQTAALAPAGAQFEARLDQELNSKALHDGDRFTLTEHEGFFHHAPPALKGAKLEGHVENVSPASATHAATMNVILDDVVTPDGVSAPIDASVTSIKEFEPKTHHLRDAALIVGGAVAGHMAGSRRGIKHGGLAGAAAGFALAPAMKSNIDVKPGTIVHLKLKKPLTPATT